jgi:hypothetical protein
MLEIETPAGIKKIAIQRFSALDGWDIHTHFTRFADSKERKDRRQYVFRVLSYARVLTNKKGVEIPLSTGALVDNHLYTAENVGKVFEAILSYNGMTPEQSAQLSDYKNTCANHMTTSFLTQCMGAIKQFVGYVMREGKTHG